MDCGAVLSDLRTTVVAPISEEALMCDLCDQPDLTVEGYVQHVRDRLTRERFLVQSVTGSASRAEYSYSVGLTAAALPELVVVGVRPAEAGRLIELWGRTCSTRASCCLARR